MSDENNMPGLRAHFKDFEGAVEKPLLALDALSKLYRQFANKPEFHGLIQTLLFTLSGQFAVPSAFAVFRKPGASEDLRVYTATGKFRSNAKLAEIDLSNDLERYFRSHSSTCRVADLDLPETCASQLAGLREAGVHVISPLIHNDSLLGIIGLAPRVTKKPFEREDIELLDTMINTNTPLVVSSYHFWEMTSLSAWYLDILNNVRQGVFVFDHENRLRKANQTGHNILRQCRRYLPDVVMLDGQFSSEVFPDSVFPGWAERFAQAHTVGGGQTIDNLVTRIDQVEFVYEAYVTGISAGSTENTDYIVTLDDVTERKRTERARGLKFERAERQKAAINRMATDRTTDIADFNRAARIATEIIGEATQVERNSLWLFDQKQEQIQCVDLFERSSGRHSSGDVIKAIDYPRYFEALKKGRAVDANCAQSDPRTSEFAEHYLIPKGITSMLDAAIRVSGEVVGVVCQEHVGAERIWESDEVRFAGEVADQVAQALINTDRKIAEDQKHELQDKLEKAERMESLGILAGGVAHDLNNMLGPLVGYPELILRKLPDASPIRRQVQRIGAAAQDAADVIQDLLTLARRGRYEMRSTDINEVIENYLDSPSYSQLIKRHPDTRVDVRLDRSIGVIDGSAPHLSKVVMNLIVNAFDAMTEAGKLEIVTEERQVERLRGGHQAIVPGAYLVLKVRDSGMGISEEDIDKIFEPYYSKKKMGASGSGLGLSVVYGIVKDHGGYYDILSTLGEGTEFILYFPVSARRVEKPVEREADVGGTESVLVVDDADEQREIAQEFLASLGYRVETVGSGREAVEYLKVNKVDLVLLDMIMEKDFDGLDTYRQITSLHPRQKALIVSGFSATERVEEMQRLGAGQYIRKPYSLTTIAKAIREELGRDPAVAHG